MRKLSTAIGSAPADPVKSSDAASPSLPAPVVENKTAPGQVGPRGLSPRTTYSRVNAGAPPLPDMSALKMAPARGAEFLPKVAQMTTVAQPTLQDMIKAAMEGTVNTVNVAQEAERQYTLHTGQQVSEKTASSSSHVSTEYVEKLAAALGFIAEQVKEGGVGPGEGANALHVMEAKDGKPVLLPGHSGHGKAQGLPAPSVTQTNTVTSGKASNGLKTNDKTMHPAQPLEPIPNEKAPLKSKHASSDLYEKNLAVLGLKKVAADQASNHAGVPSETGAPAEPSDVNKQKSMISSNEAAIKFTKGQAKADPKKDLNHLFVQPALSAAHDSVLQQAFSHTGEAGVKISAAVQTVQEAAIKTAASRALLSNLLKQAAEECAPCKDGDCKEHKSKKTASSPSKSSGFTVNSL